MHGALVQDNRVHGGITLGPLLQDPKSINCGETMNVDLIKTGFTGLNAIGSTAHNAEIPQLSSAEKRPHPSPVPEGRVHGGSLMALLSSGLSLDPSTSSNYFGGGPSVPMEYQVTQQSWL